MIMAILLIVRGVTGVVAHSRWRECCGRSWRSILLRGVLGRTLSRNNVVLAQMRRGVCRRTIVGVMMTDMRSRIMMTRAGNVVKTEIGEGHVQ
jgi:hypothetical protein